MICFCDYKSLFLDNECLSNEKRYPTAMAFQHQAAWYKNFLRFQGAQPDHVRVESPSCCFPGELVIALKGVSKFDPPHVTGSPPIRNEF